MKVSLTIAGSDPTGGAGLQEDLKVFHKFGVYGISVVSALTAQNTFKVSAVSAVDVNFIGKQLRTLLDDILPDSLKTGMLFSESAVRAVVKIINTYELQNLVVDPVAISSTGTRLIEREALALMKKKLFPLAKVITPNIQEAIALSGINIKTEADMKKAAAELMKFGPEAVIITGGHFDQISRQASNHKKTMELIYDSNEFHYIRGEKLEGEYHGTGCAFSAAITALLAKGLPVVEAASKAKKLMTTAIKNASDIGKGMRILNV